MARRPTRVLGRALAATTAVVIAVVGAPQVASAHANLVRSAPDDGAVVTSPRESIALTFNEEMQAQYATIAVTGPNDRKIQEGAPAVRGKMIRQPIDPFRVTGRYRVGWRAVSADGHPVSGSFTFQVRQGAIAKPAASSSTGEPPSPNSKSRRAVGEQSADQSFVERHAVHLALGGLLVVLAVAVVVWDRRRRHD